jgi:hypothetical protein
MTTTPSNNRQVFTFGSEENNPSLEKFSSYLPIDIKPLFGRNWVTNGEANQNFAIFKDAYEDSPTNASIINSYVNYIFGEGLIDKNSTLIDKYISQEDTLLAVQDLKIYGGFSFQVIWNMIGKPLKLKYIPIYKLGVNYEQKNQEVNGYWFSYDWKNKGKYRPKFYPTFTGKYTEDQDIEILYVRRPTSETFFPIPDYLAGINWARMEGAIANGGFNFYQNSLSELTVINYNNGECDSATTAKDEADRVRKDITGSSNNGKVIVAFNDGAENAVTVDRIPPAEMSQHNVFYSEEAERKLIVAHSAPPILFAGSNQSGFSSNAEERAIAIKGLYRNNINPFRLTFLNGLYSVFQLIDPNIVLAFKDFEEATQLDTVDNAADNTNVEGTAVEVQNDATTQAQAQLKGSVGGVQSLLEVQASYVKGTTTYEAAIAILDLIFGFNRLQAIRLLGNPEVQDEPTNIDNTAI